MIGSLGVKPTLDFKICPSCGVSWESLRDFIGDPSVQSIGYQAESNPLEIGLFFFTHNVCGTTMAVAAGQFLDFYEGGPIYNDPLWESGKRPEHCLSNDEPLQCPERCACAYIGETMQTLLNWERDKSVFTACPPAA